MTDPGRTIALVGILLVAVGAWLAVPLSLWHVPDLDLGFTQNNVAYVVGQVALPATLVLAAGGTTLGLRGLHLAALIVTGAHLLLEVVIGAVQLILGARVPLTVGTGMEVFVLGLALAGLVVSRSASLRGPTTQRWVALGLVTAAAALSILPDLIRYPVDDISYLPLMLPGLAGGIAVVLAAGLVGLARPWARYTAAGVLVAITVLLLVGLPWGWELDEYMIVWVVGDVARGALVLMAAVLAFLAARRLRQAPQQARLVEGASPA
ncbi:hypothetical protein L1785_05345 [Antribacter sp. KLBMP9083]|uniref:Uncharacterized protein n=1 Tax=Antribacter soli TaxID=2910976 RepID=A0AA41QBX1_9MICO|nr:hypothetical protein [Antribacter soli]MCF4120398.1 hypothetical protein [Antribacter soli]